MLHKGNSTTGTGNEFKRTAKNRVQSMSSKELNKEDEKACCVMVPRFFWRRQGEDSIGLARGVRGSQLVGGVWKETTFSSC